MPTATKKTTAKKKKNKSAQPKKVIFTGKLLRDALHGANPPTITFTKINGSTRVLRATTLMSLIPEDQHPQIADLSKPLPKLNLDVIRCFDLDLDEWRSFRINSVTALVTR